MICAELEDRIFDEDCRAALLGRAPVPADVAEHVARCPTCAREWTQACVDVRRLSERLVVSPPPALRRALHRAVRPRTRPRTLRIDSDTLSWAVAGGAMGALCVPPGLPEWAGFCAGASVGLALLALPYARQGWLAPWAPVRAVASRSVDTLLRVL
jgi:hypothetical protein